MIGGTSLFGGRGKMLGAVLGGVIVAVIYNGLQLLGLGAAAQNMWTAAVLLAAVTVDTLTRRGPPGPSNRCTKTARRVQGIKDHYSERAVVHALATVGR